MGSFTKCISNDHDDNLTFFLVRCFQTSDPCSDHVSHHRCSVLGNDLCSVNIYFDIQNIIIEHIRLLAFMCQVIQSCQVYDVK